jgi:Family of unknown function (DUF5872)
MVKRSKEVKYTDPELRERIKEEIKQSSKGGKPGQWSARKSQLLAQEYEKRGGGYKGEKDEDQQNLERWTEEGWQTQEGGTRARDGDETARYLPKKAWENMSEEEKRATEQKKREGSRKGEQYVANTEEARDARKGLHAPPIKNYDDLSVGDASKKLDGLSDEQLEEVRDYEKRNKNRKTLVRLLDRKL